MIEKMKSCSKASGGASVGSERVFWLVYHRRVSFLRTLSGLQQSRCAMHQDLRSNLFLETANRTFHIKIISYMWMTNYLKVAIHSVMALFDITWLACPSSECLYQNEHKWL